jgi:hypothetical protein
VWALLLAQISLVDVAGTSLVVTDNATGIPVTVRVSPFAIAATETTQRDYESVMGSNPSTHRGAALPVHNVTWWEAIRFCNLLSLREGLEPVYDVATGAARPASGYRLPTAIEWAHAAGPPAKDSGHLGPSQTKDTGPLVGWARATAPKATGTSPPNHRGLHDMYGNVWEWVQDWADPSQSVWSGLDPAGPPSGVERLVRGGSYMSSTSSWSKGYRASMDPSRRSPFTGFRVCRSRGAYTPDYPADWFAPYQDAPAAFRTATGGLAPIDGNRDRIRARWMDALGSLSTPKPTPEARLIRRDQADLYTAELRELRVEQDYWEKIYLMLPRTPRPRPLPVVVVPYYDIDTPAGANLGGRLYTPLGTRSFGHLATQLGFAAVAIRWFGESYSENYSEAVANLKLRHPGATGLGKWVWDSQRLLDYLETVPGIDASRAGMVGHSLGGKMTLYAAALDPRIRVAVSSEPGIGLAFSNYDDFWYLGENIRKLPKGADHHELLALVAPRPFLLIGGDSSDGDRSWHYINAARPLFADPRHIAYLNHRKGHSPTPESVWRAMEWLRRFLDSR